MAHSKRVPELPEAFSCLEEQPDTLYYQGKLSFLEQPKVSIVGTRKPYAYTRNYVRSLASELSKRGVYVVSGLAMGVDAIAHEGAFPKTIGVLANGLDIIYPKVNKKLFEKMYEDALIVSEYDDGVEARSFSFVHRNRLVVALGEVLVVAQADEKSGSMRSVEYALEMGKKIYVLPHRLGESEGTMGLVREGKAELITDIKAFAEQFGEMLLEDDAFLAFCQQGVSYEEALAFDSAKLFEYELLGKVIVQHGRVVVA